MSSIAATNATANGAINPTAAQSPAELTLTTTPAPAAPAVPACVVRPEMTEGPYFVAPTFDATG